MLSIKDMIFFKFMLHWFEIFYVHRILVMVLLYTVLLCSYNHSPWGAWWLSPFLHKLFGKTELCHQAVIVDKCSNYVCVFSSELLFSNTPPSCHFLLSDSSALDTQVLSHCLSPTTLTCDSLACACVCQYVCVLRSVVWCRVDFVTPLN